MKKKKDNLKKFYGSVKVSERGQIAIPLELREDLGIKKGDILLVGRRADNRGLVLVKPDIVEEIFNMQEDIFS
ncbi:MAG: AbrB/MazE/SpoVT family DNA-binding domain-containing protein [Spirochaetes bacterium]|nr:AbrB/MazE/SpoVT family DNA-binding domain-containing protein [Spirochaetota bacterium]